MSRRTRFKYQAANQLGVALSKSADYTLTKANILQDGNQFIKMSGSNVDLTLPAADEDLDGILLRVSGGSGGGNVYVAAGFNGGGANYDVVRMEAYTTQDFWCDGTYWYALGVALSATVSSSSSSSSSSSLSSSSSSSSSSSG